MQQFSPYINSYSLNTINILPFKKKTLFKDPEQDDDEMYWKETWHRILHFKEHSLLLCSKLLKFMDDSFSQSH